MLRALLVALIVTFSTVAGAEPILRTTATTQQDFLPPTCAVVGTTTATCDHIVPYDGVFVPEGVISTSRQVATASASFGTLDAQVWEASPLDFGLPLMYYTLLATGEFTDDLTVTGGLGSGYVQYLFSGAAHSGSSQFLNRSGFQVRHDDGLLLDAAWAYDFGGTTHGTIEWESGPPGGSGGPASGAFAYMSPPLPFIWDVPFQLYVYGQAATTIDGDCCGSGYFNVTLDAINVFNANQQRVGAEIFSASGTPYTVTAIPEPASLLMVGAGLAAAALRRNTPAR